MRHCLTICVLLLLGAARASQPYAACDAQSPPLSSQAADDCVLCMVVCGSPALTAWMAVPDYTASMCSGMTMCIAPPPHDEVVALTAAALLNLSATQGAFFNDYAGGLEENATQALTYLLDTMPRRDMLLLAEAPIAFTEFLWEHIRYALYAYHSFSRTLGVTWGDFLDAVLPYAVIDEKRDVAFRWRPRFFTALMPVVAGATNVSGAFLALVVALPSTQITGAVALGGTLAAGPPVTWRSESSPARLSVQDVVQWGGSCTGTAVLQVAAARSVGLPVRLAGCSSESTVADDHHWTEVRDWANPGPFGSYWHTREGASAGNANGPWDAPSAPMLGCLAGLVPGSSVDTLWASSWGSRTNLPLMWSNDARTATWARVGGVNVCGDYCSAWGCGPGNAIKYNQSACGPA